LGESRARNGSTVIAELERSNPVTFTAGRLCHPTALARNTFADYAHDRERLRLETLQFSFEELADIPSSHRRIVGIAEGALIFGTRVPIPIAAPRVAAAAN
jgi:hypothetical protein